MTEFVTMSLDEVGVRQNYEPESLGERHWLLDFPAGRDLLKIALVKELPAMKSALWGDPDGVDAELDRMVDVLGLRDLQQPVGALESLKMTGTLLKRQVQVQFGRG